MTIAINERRVLSAVTSAVILVNRELQGDDVGRRGGYFCMGGPNQFGVFTVTDRRPIGPTPTKKRRRYKDLSLQKLNRLFFNPGYFSSWQLRKPERDQWGGAIRAGDYIFSFSGLPELADEAAMLIVAVMLLLLTYEQACSIAELSNNQYFLGNGIRDFLGQHPRTTVEE